MLNLQLHARAAYFIDRSRYRVDTVQDVSIDIPINAVRFPRKSVKKTPPLERPLKSRYNLSRITCVTLQENIRGIREI